MFEIGDTVLYGKEGVCKIGSIEKRRFFDEYKEYYVLISESRSNSRIYVPVDNERLMASLRKVLSREEIDELIKRIGSYDMAWQPNDALRKEEYAAALSKADCFALGVMLKTLYYKKAELKASGKKLRRFDEDFFVQAQNLLFNEFAHVLKISKNEVLSYIVDHE